MKTSTERVQENIAALKSGDRLFPRPNGMLGWLARADIPHGSRFDVYDTAMEASARGMVAEVANDDPDLTTVGYPIYVIR